ncbi:MAG: NADPH:quinone oxidoreductase family protein [Planctomycetota bacterium]
MRAVRCHRYAGFNEQDQPLTQTDPLRDVLTLDQVPVPECNAGHVLVEVHFAGIQYPDAFQAQGFYQERPSVPYIPGVDISGIVREIGNDVDTIQVGDRVVAKLSMGGLAEVAAAEADSVWPVPEHVDLATCANLSRNYISAYHSLKVVGEIQSGDLVLIDGASGGVGMAAIELAKAMGAKVIAGVSSETKMEFPEQAGADVVLCYGRDKASYRQFKTGVREACASLGHPAGVDAVIDMVQGELFEAALVSAVRPLGKLVLVGFTAGQKPIRPGMLLIKQAAAVGSLWASWAKQFPNEQRQNVQEILEFFRSGAIKPRVDRVFPLDEFLSAFELFEQNQGRGNTAVHVQGPPAFSS